jgi:hypothetical protein
MATRVGKDGAVKIGANAVAEIRDWSVEQTSEVVNDTVMGDAWMSNKATQKSWTASFNAYWDDTDTNGQLALDVGTEVTLNLYSEDTSGAVYWSGTAIISSVSQSASFDGLVEASFSATGNGALTESTVA